MIVEKQILGVGEAATMQLSVGEAMRCLKRAFPKGEAPEGYLAGRTRIRNAIADGSGCSLLRAEEMVELLEKQERIHYMGDQCTLETAPATWQIRDI